jgi:hypothetical protein
MNKRQTYESYGIINLWYDFIIIFTGIGMFNLTYNHRKSTIWWYSFGNSQLL